MDKTKLGDRMKEYESQSQTKLLRRLPVIIRVDGRAFHTFTKGLNKPFDIDFQNIMINTMKKLCQEIQVCVMGYCQSDEITLVLVDYKNINSDAWFDNKVQKIVSTSAALATLYFNQEVETRNCFNAEYYKIFENLWEKKRLKATFDSRAFNLPKHKVINCLIWRQQDAIRNSIQALAQCHFSHKEIQGLSCDELKEKLFSEKAVNWDDNIANDFKWGVCCVKDDNGNWVIDYDIPLFTEDRDYVDKLVMLEQ